MKEKCGKFGEYVVAIGVAMLLLVGVIIVGGIRT